MPEPDHMGHILEQRVTADPHEREDTQRDQRYGHNDDLGGEIHWQPLDFRVADQHPVSYTHLTLPTTMLV